MAMSRPFRIILGVFITAALIGAAFIAAGAACHSKENDCRTSEPTNVGFIAAGVSIIVMSIAFILTFYRHDKEHNKDSKRYKRISIVYTVLAIIGIALLIAGAAIKSAAITASILAAVGAVVLIYSFTVILYLHY